MTERLVRALLSPACYPHPAAAIRLLETHISWVLLAGDYAYKIKKPVNFGFLDFSSLAKRRHYCEEELRLNSRFSNSLYLEVAAITGGEDSPRVKGEGEAIEYAVRMRQFPQDRLLDKLAEAGKLDDALARALGRKLADFHQRVAARLPAEDRELGTPKAVGGAALENFRQLEPLLEEKAELDDLAVLRRWTAEKLRLLGPFMEERREKGFVRECHGDLHLANIALLESEPVFFDCIEFNEQLRWIDTMSELAFLLMDMEEKELAAPANRLLNIYVEYSGDYDGLALLDFYKVYRAMVRAKVTMLRIAGGGLDAEEESRARQEYEKYIRLGRDCRGDRQVFLAIMHGVSGTGKSTAAAAIAGETGAIRIRSDVERKRLFGLPPDAPSGEEQKARIYNREASARTRQALLDTARGLLENGYAVIADATFIATQWRRPFMELAARLDVPFVILDCRASERTILERLERREARKAGASDAGIDIMRGQLAYVEPLSDEEARNVVVIDTEQSLDAAGLRDFLQGSAEGLK